MTNNIEHSTPHIKGGHREPRIMGLLETAGEIIDHNGGGAEILRDIEQDDIGVPRAVIWESPYGDSVTSRGATTDIIHGAARIESIPTALLRDVKAPVDDEIDLRRYNWAGSTYQPRGSKWGWSRPFGSREVRFHKRGSAAATVFASLALSAVATGVASSSDQEVPEFVPHISWTSSGVDERIIVDRDTTQVIGPEMVLRRTTVEPLPGPTDIPETSLSTGNLLQMALAPDFLLNSEQTRAIDREKLSAYLDKIQQYLAEGYALEDITITGLASDETALDAQMGIGALDPENEQLSADRAELVRGAFAAGLEDRAIDIDEINVSYEERVLSGQDAADASVLLDKYRNSDEQLTPSESERLAELLDQNRGGFIEVTMTKPEQEVEPSYRTITVEECVVEERRDIIFHTETTPYENDHTIVVLVLPIPIARRDKWSTEPEKYVTYTFGGPADPPQEPPSTEVVPQPPESPTPAEGQQGRGRARVTASRAERVPKPRLSYIERRRRKERNQRIRTIGAGIITLAVLVSPRGDVGYCPDPSDLQDQSFSWTQLPNRLDVGLGIPFTDIETPKVTLFDETCRTDEPEAPAPTSLPGDEQPCTTITTRYENGLLVEQLIETNPNATETTVTITE